MSDTRYTCQNCGARTHTPKELGWRLATAPLWPDRAWLCKDCHGDLLAVLQATKLLASSRLARGDLSIERGEHGPA
jgi:uncharacterized protein YlaI